MAIKIKKEREIKEIPQKEKFILFISFLISIATLSGYLVTTYYADIVSQKQKVVLASFEEGETKISKLNEWEFVFIKDYRKINFIGQLIEKRKISKNFFELLEAITHPHIYFETLDLDTENNKAHLEGVAYSFMSFGQQVNLMREKTFLTEGEVSGLLRIKSNVLGKDLHEHTISFHDENGLVIKITSPEGELKTKKSDNIESLEEDIYEMTGVPVTITFLKEVSLDTINGKSVYLLSENLIKEVEVIEAKVEKDPKETINIEEEVEEEVNEEEEVEEEVNEEEEEVEEIIYFPGEVDFYIIVTLNPRAFGVKE